MPPREQQKTGRELSLLPPSQLPTVVGQMGGQSPPVVNQDMSGQLPGQVPLPSPSGSVDSPVYPQLPPTPSLDRQPATILPEPISVGLPPVHNLPDIPLPQPPMTQNPFQPSARDHKSLEYDPSYWSQPWRTKTP